MQPSQLAIDNAGSFRQDAWQFSRRFAFFLPACDLFRPLQFVALQQLLTKHGVKNGNSTGCRAAA